MIQHTKFFHKVFMTFKMASKHLWISNFLTIERRSFLTIHKTPQQTDAYFHTIKKHFSHDLIPNGKATTENLLWNHAPVDHSFVLKHDEKQCNRYNLQ